MPYGHDSRDLYFVEKTKQNLNIIYKCPPDFVVRKFKEPKWELFQVDRAAFQQSSTNQSV